MPSAKKKKVPGRSTLPPDWVHPSMYPASLGGGVMAMPGMFGQQPSMPVMPGAAMHQQMVPYGHQPQHLQTERDQDDEDEDDEEEASSESRRLLNLENLQFQLML